MMKLKVVGDPVEVAKALGTNRPMVHGQEIVCGSEFKMREFAAANPGLVAVIEEDGAVVPEANKMLKKGKGFKSK